MMHKTASVLGLDIGTVRIGVAKANWPDGIPSPYTTLANDQSLINGLRSIAESENVRLVVAGRPRGMSGQNTEQTAYTNEVLANIKSSLSLPVYSQDEAVTSVQAESELKSRGKPYTKDDIDALSAVYILEDFIHEHPKGAGIEVGV